MSFQGNRIFFIRIKEQMNNVFKWKFRRGEGDLPQQRKISQNNTFWLHISILSMLQTYDSPPLSEKKWDPSKLKAKSQAPEYTVTTASRSRVCLCEALDTNLRRDHHVHCILQCSTKLGEHVVLTNLCKVSLLITTAKWNSCSLKCSRKKNKTLYANQRL